MQINPEDSSILDAHATAYAEIGNYQKAIEFQEEAILRLDATPSVNTQDDREQYILRLHPYKEKKPYHEKL